MLPDINGEGALQVTGTLKHLGGGASFSNDPSQKAGQFGIPSSVEDLNNIEYVFN